MKDSGYHISILFQLPERLQLTNPQGQKDKKEFLQRDNVRPAIPWVIIHLGCWSHRAKVWSLGRSHHPLTHLWALPSQLRQTLTLSVPGLTHTWQQALVLWQKDQTLKCLYRGSSSVRGTQHDSGACPSWLTVGKTLREEDPAPRPSSCYSKHAQSLPTIWQCYFPLCETLSL